ncbi:MAG TPA: prolipoprotein diacylglyceryl transferase [Syntrophomonadaceae bacterium]|nr:prolipoprotein diacylglyceryl transferase [Syntrophomonadaceae bacterium]
MRRVLFSLGPFPVYTFGFMMALGVLAATLIVYIEANRKGLNRDRVLDFVLWALVFGILGARLGYILFADPLYYLRNPLQFFHIQDGGLSIHGAVIGGVFAGLLLSRRYRLPFWRLADAFAPGLALGIAIGRVGCDVFGRPMSSPWPWGVVVNGQLLHPAQVYEFVLDYLLFFYLWRQRKKVTYDGRLFLLFIALYAAIRGMVEFVRYNPRVVGPFSVAHLASLVFIIAAGSVDVILKHRSRPKVIPGARPEAAASGIDGIAGKLEDSLLWQSVLLILAIALSLLVFYGFPVGS